MVLAASGQVEGDDKGTEGRPSEEDDIPWTGPGTWVRITRMLISTACRLRSPVEPTRSVLSGGTNNLTDKFGKSCLRMRPRVTSQGRKRVKLSGFQGGHVTQEGSPAQIPRCCLPGPPADRKISPPTHSPPCEVRFMMRALVPG